MVREDTQLESDAREQLKSQYAQRAMDLLVKAESVGWFTGGSAVKFLANDADFDILRDRKDFQQLLQKVQARFSKTNESLNAI